MPVHRGLGPVRHQKLYQVGADDVLPELGLLQELEVLQGRAGIRQVLEVGRALPVLQIGQVGDEGGLAQVFLRREIVEVEGVGERLHELRTGRGGV